MASKTKASSDQKKRDPFAYFGGLGDGDEDDLSESDNEEEETAINLSFISKSATNDNQTREMLPPADDVLFVTKQPEFLKQDKKKDVDWEKLVKDDTKEEEEPIDYSTNAIPPPKTYDPVSEPIKPSLGNNEEVNKGGTKRPSNDDSDAESPKKSKNEDS